MRPIKKKYNNEVIVAKLQLDKEGVTSSNQEFSLMVSNNHPNIIKFLDFLKDSNTLIMEFRYLFRKTK